MSNQNAVKLTPSTMNYVELSSQYNVLMNKCEGRDPTPDEETKLLKVMDMYGKLFGVNRVTACEQMREGNNF